MILLLPAAARASARRWPVLKCIGREWRRSDASEQTERRLHQVRGGARWNLQSLAGICGALTVTAVALGTGLVPSRKLYAGILFMALIVSAVLGGLLVELFVWATPGSLLATDPVLQLTLMVASAMPSAINMLTLASMHGTLVDATTRLLFFSYLCSAITVPAAAVVYVVLLDN